MRSDLVSRRMILMVLVSSLLLAEGPKRTIYVDRMEGLEPYVEKALLDAELSFNFIEEAKRPEMKAELKRLHSVYGEILYQHKFGRSETHRLELRNVETNEVIAWHQFKLGDTEASKKAAAADFAAKVKTALLKRDGKGQS